MSLPIEPLIELTALRDREAMDAQLVLIVQRAMQAEQVLLRRIVGDPGQERWLQAVRLQAGQPAERADLHWVNLQQLPRLDSHPDQARCVRQATEIQLPGAGSSGHVLLVPLSSDRGVIGVLEVSTARLPSPTARRSVAGLLSIYRNLVNLLDYSESDTLTGLLNRKSFDEAFYKASALPLLERPGGASERRGLGEARAMHYWLGVVDIDHFKMVNDQHGHLIGDEVLLLLSRVMRQSFRFLDKLYRFGGEEFVVLLRCESEAHAISAMERFRGNVEAYKFPRVVSVTVSIGLTDVRAGDTPPSAVERADLAVYYAKHHGRNQVRSHSALVREGHLADPTQTSDVELF
jgi:diguanylate cyclase (GGDEF)-like protein